MAGPKVSEPQLIVNRIPEFVNAFKRKREDERVGILAQLVSALVLTEHEYGETYAALITTQAFH